MNTRPSLRKRLGSLMPYTLVFGITFITFTASSWLAQTRAAARTKADAESSYLPYEALHLIGHPDAAQALQDKPTLLLVADTQVGPQVRALTEHLALTAKKPFNRLVVSDNPDLLQSAVKAPEGVFYSSGAAFDPLLHRLKMNRSTPSWAIYDGHGTLRGRGIFSSDGVSYFLRTVVEADTDLTGVYLKKSANESLGHELGQLTGSAARGEHGAVALLLVEQVSSTCPEFETIRMLETTSKHVPVMLVPLGKLSEDDGRRLLGNYNLPFTILPPNDALRGWWSGLKASYGLGPANGSVLFVGNQGVTAAATTAAELHHIEESGVY